MAISDVQIIITLIINWIVFILQPQMSDPANPSNTIIKIFSKLIQVKLWTIHKICGQKKKKVHSINPKSDGGRGWLHQLFGKRAPAMSVLIFVSQKPNYNYSLAFLLTFMQNIFFIFLVKFWVVEVAGRAPPWKVFRMPNFDVVMTPQCLETFLSSF